MLIPQRAEAHVFIKDRTNSVGAILHITPDDDPVAGEESTIFFDVQQPGGPQTSYYYELLITDEAGISRETYLTATGNTATGTYLFPEQGQYDLQLKLTPKSGDARPLEFVFSQRVARGTGSGQNSKPPYPGWTDPLVIGAISGLLALGVIAYNRRSEIIAYSRFT